MGSAVRGAVAVCGTAREEVNEVSSLIRQGGVFHVHPVCWPDASALASARAVPVRGYVVLAGNDAASEELRELVKDRPSDVPLVALGGDAPPESSACWLRATPPKVLLCSLLEELIPAQVQERVSEPPPPSRAWRRKSDMIIGVSGAVTQLLGMLDRLAPSSAPVLITGESGTGKELVARALHYSGPRARGPFIALNCAAIPETLFEAELFGYQRGAFTGAVTARPGAFEAADTGTLFLDEIGEIPLSMQVKLLRVLETGAVTRLGENESRKLDSRVVAATNRTLREEVKHGRFREDLFYRVSVYPVQIPPLRDRAEDIAPLVAHYLEEIARRERKPTPRLTHAALETLLSYRWPGNVRELVNALERAVLMADLKTIDAQHIVLPKDSTPLIVSYKEAKENFERQYYTQLVSAAGGNITLAAKLSSKTRKEIYDAMKRLDMNAEQYREQSESASRIPVGTPRSDDDD